jgi:phosphatidylglycerophosphatase A
VESALLWIGSIGPLGHAPASGTVAVAVAGIPLYWLLSTNLSHWSYLVVTILFTGAAMALHHAGDKILGESDSRKLVWDELSGYLFAMFALGWHWKLAVLGFFIERFIDIAKVPPANVIDRKMHNGVGVVLDDVVAGIYTCALLHGLVRLIPWLVQ